MLAYLISSLFNKSTKDKNIHGCEGKKTAQFDKLIATLLQTSVSWRLVRFVPIKIGMLFCVLAVLYIVFSFCLYAANCPLCHFLHLPITCRHPPIAGISELAVKANYLIVITLIYFVRLAAKGSFHSFGF